MNRIRTEQQGAVGRETQAPPLFLQEAAAIDFRRAYFRGHNGDENLQAAET
jgi:hypothetical protein